MEGFAALSDLRCTFSAHTSRTAVTALSFTTELRSSAIKIAAFGHGVRLKHRCIDSPGSPPPYIFIHFFCLYVHKLLSASIPQANDA